MLHVTDFGQGSLLCDYTYCPRIYKCIWEFNLLTGCWEISGESTPKNPDKTTSGKQGRGLRNNA